jgi:hypothetical protein
MPSAVRALALVAVVAPALAHAQRAPADSLARDAVVRVTVPGLRLNRTRAVAERATADSLRLRLRLAGPDSVAIAVAWADVRELSVSRGTSYGRGAARGAIAGAMVIGVPGVALTAYAYLYERRRAREGAICECYFGTAIVGALTVAGAGAGAIVGAVIGATTGVERWQPVRVPARVGFAPSPQGLGVRVAF